MWARTTSVVAASFPFDAIAPSVWWLVLAVHSCSLSSRPWTRDVAAPAGREICDNCLRFGSRESFLSARIRRWAPPTPKQASGGLQKPTSCLSEAVSTMLA